MKIYDYNGKSNISGARSRRRRRALKLSQSELAARLQLQNAMLDQKAVSRVEKGERFVADFELLAFSRALNLSLEALLGLEEGLASPSDCDTMSSGRPDSHGTGLAE